MCEISWEMLSTKELKINYKHIPDWIREYFGPRVATAEEDHWRHDLLSQTMLVRDDDGYYRPAHKSLIEFFSAYKLAAAIGALKVEYVEAAGKHANVDRNLQPTAQQWSVYFRALGVGQQVAPLLRFAKDSIDELEKTWARVAVDDATREFIFLLCGQSTLLRYVKDKTSPEKIESTIAARVLEVAAFSRDLHGADLSGAIVSGCHLRNCDLSNIDLSTSSWFESSFGQVSFDHAVLQGASFREVSFIDVTFRNADLSNSLFDITPYYISIISGIWCTSGDKEILLIVLVDGRIIAITPETLVVQALDESDVTHQELASKDWAAWVLEQSDTFDLAGFGPVCLDRNGWHRDVYWERRKLAPGLRSHVGYDALSYADVVLIKVTVEATNQVLLDLRFYDASEFGGPETRPLAISKNGKYVAAVHYMIDRPVTAAIFSTESTSQLPLEVPLRSFSGGLFVRGDPNTTNNPGAFSSSGNILAVCERQNVVGFWRTSDGECIGRVIFETAARGCIVDGATGLPPEFVMANSDGKDGWIVEPSSE